MARETTKTPHGSEGARLLDEYADSLGLSNDRIGEMVSVSGETVRRWRRSDKAPYAKRAELERALSIPASSWERAPSSPSPAAALAAKLKPGALPEDAEGLAGLVQQIARARAETGISAVTLAKLGAVEVRAREAHAKCRSWDEAAILASPAFERIETALTAALEPPADANDEAKRVYADLMRRVADAFVTLDTARAA